jgi:hypothetical protein
MDVDIHPRGRRLQFLTSRQLLDGEQLSLQPLLPGDDWGLGLTPVAGAVGLQLPQQCLELLIEVVECECRASLSHGLCQLHVELHDLLGHTFHGLQLMP